MNIDLSLQLNENDQVVSILKGNKRNLFELGHFGTHIDVHLKTKVSLDNMNLSAVMFDVKHVQERDIMLVDFDYGKVTINDFVIFRTDMIKRYQYGTKDYFLNHPQLSHEVIQYLIGKKIKLIGIDAAGIRRGEEHVIADKLCEENNIYIIENLTNLDILANQDKDRFKMTTLWIDLPNKTGLPCRVVATV